MKPETTKLSELAPLRLDPALAARLEAARLKTGEKRPQFIRRALVAQLDRDEAATLKLTPEDLQLLDCCRVARARGLDPQFLLTEALEADCEKAAAGFQPGQVGLPASL